jgi:hypothetical protein
MGVVSMIKTAVGAGDDVGDLVSQIDAVRAKGVAAHQELDRLEAARLMAEDFETAKALGERIERVSWEADRLAALLPQLENRLAIARNAKQTAAIARHAAANRKAWPRFRAALLAAVDAQEEMIKMREDAGKEIGEHAVTLNLPVQAFAGFLRREHFDIWDSELSRVMAAPAPQPAVAAVVKPAQVGPVKPPAKPAPAAQPVAPVAPPRPPRQPRRDKVAVGGKLVVMTRSGVEIDGEQTVAGDQIALPAEQAKTLAEAGACEYVNA